MNKLTIIVSIGAEGGALVLYGHKDSKQAWKFARAVNDQTLTFLDEEEGGGAINHQSGWVNSWTEAVTLLDRYPWAMLKGLAVHPEFSAPVWAAVLERLQGQPPVYAEGRRAQWARVCGVNSG